MGESCSIWFIFQSAIKERLEQINRSLFVQEILHRNENEQIYTTRGRVL